MQRPIQQWATSIECVGIHFLVYTLCKRAISSVRRKFPLNVEQSCRREECGGCWFQATRRVIDYISKGRWGSDALKRTSRQTNWWHLLSPCNQSLLIWCCWIFNTDNSSRRFTGAHVRWRAKCLPTETDTILYFFIASDIFTTRNENQSRARNVRCSCSGWDCYINLNCMNTVAYGICLSWWDHQHNNYGNKKIRTLVLTFVYWHIYRYMFQPFWARKLHQNTSLVIGLFLLIIQISITILNFRTPYWKNCGLKPWANYTDRATAACLWS
jgi:hypothetical protein